MTEDDFLPSLKITKEIAEKIGVQQINTDCNLAKVSIVDDGIAKEAGIALRMFRALSRSGIHMETINTSRIRISCLIKLAQLDKAAKALQSVEY